MQVTLKTQNKFDTMTIDVSAAKSQSSFWTGSSCIHCSVPTASVEKSAGSSLRMKTMLCFNRQILGIIGPAYYLLSSRPHSVTDHCQLKELSVTQWPLSIRDCPVLLLIVFVDYDVFCLNSVWSWVVCGMASVHASVRFLHSSSLCW